MEVFSVTKLRKKIQKDLRYNLVLIMEVLTDISYN